jgi:hypothetical protein
VAQVAGFIGFHINETLTTFFGEKQGNVNKSDGLAITMNPLAAK